MLRRYTITSLLRSFAVVESASGDNHNNMEHNEILIQPDARGRVLLTRITQQLSSHYVGHSLQDGSILLIPAVVEAKSPNEVMQIHPLLDKEINERIASGDRGQPSDLWEHVMKPSHVAGSQA